jgi:hypothetical protein
VIGAYVIHPLHQLTSAGAFGRYCTAAGLEVPKTNGIYIQYNAITDQPDPL